MCRAAHVVAVVTVINVNRIAVAPAGRQRTGNNKPIPVILEARMARDNYRVANPKPMFPSKMRPEMIFRNAPVMMAFVFFIADEMRVMFAMMVMVVPIFVVTSPMPGIVVPIMLLQRCGAHGKNQECGQRHSNQLREVMSP